MSTIPFTINVQSGPKEDGNRRDFEARFARRAMMLMRRLLGEKGMTDLLRDDISIGNDYWRMQSKISNGQWKASRIKISSRGLSSKDFLAWFVPKDGVVPPENVASHPEHWVVYLKAGTRTLSVLETLGDKVSLFDLALDDGKPADFVEDDPTHPTKMTGSGYTKDGVHMLEVYHQFKDHEDGQGFDSDLSIYFPASCEEELIETHRQHLLVEFSNWFEHAYTDLKTKQV